MRAAIYARYSSDNQRPASIEDQVRKCQEAIAARGWREAGVYKDLEVSGTVTQRRPGYQRVLAAAKAQEFGVLVVDELSRLTRDQEELAGLHKRLRFWGIGLVALADGLDTVAAPGAAAPIMAIKGLINENELEANAHRSRRGLEGRVLAGLHAGGAPYGYRTRAVHADKPGDPEGTGPIIGYEYVIHEAEAETIRRIFRLYAEGCSTRQIASTLNAEGVPPPAKRWPNRRGVARHTWSHVSLAGDRRKGTGILNNPKYRGQLIWNRSTWPRDPDRDGRQVRRHLPRDQWVTVDTPHLRIVPQELWDAVKARQQAVGRGSATPGMHRRNQRLLSGLLICGHCGSRLTLRGKNTYACAASHDRGPSVCTSTVRVNARACGGSAASTLRG